MRYRRLSVLTDEVKKQIERCDHQQSQMPARGGPRRLDSIRGGALENPVEEESRYGSGFFRASAIPASASGAMMSYPALLGWTPSGLSSALRPPSLLAIGEW